MENFLISLRVVLTMAVPLLIGVLLRRCNTVTADFNRTVNGVVYHVCLPISLGCSIYRSDLGGVRFPFAAVALMLGLLAVSFGILLAVTPRIVSDRPKAASLVQAIFRGNASIYGIPIATALYGAENIGLFCILITIGVTVFNLFSILTFSILTPEKRGGGHVLLSVLKNPSILGILTGLLLKLLPVRLPSMLYDPISAVGAMVTPLCFIGIGSTFSLALLRRNWRYTASACVGKLLALPLLAVGVAVLAGYRGEILLSFLAVFATPCAIASYSMAEKLGGDGALSAQCIVLTSTFSLFSIFFWIYLLKFFALL